MPSRNVVFIDVFFVIIDKCSRCMLFNEPMQCFELKCIKKTYHHLHKIVIFYLSQISFNKSIDCCGFTDKPTASSNLISSTRKKTVGVEIYVHFAFKNCFFEQEIS